ncbi:hypothetical protein ACOSP6_11930 [Tenacibaculum sp. MEBiC06402]|uniref:hypothetical protein n=2 Tax=unclassified Tenacibaculum TaxID=2635139 RepID=UPI003B9A7922
MNWSCIFKIVIMLIGFAAAAAFGIASVFACAGNIVCIALTIAATAIVIGLGFWVIYNLLQNCRD